MEQGTGSRGSSVGLATLAEEGKRGNPKKRFLKISPQKTFEGKRGNPKKRFLKIPPHYLEEGGKGGNPKKRFLKIPPQHLGWSRPGREASFRIELFPLSG